MRRKLFAFILAMALILVTFSGCAQSNAYDNGKINIVSTIFPQYDFAREITGDKANLKMLIPPAGEAHTYEPTPQDIISIENSDVFLYIGGESDEWVDNILDSVDKSKTRVVKLIDYVDTKEEEDVEGMQSHENEEEEPETDEHIWTSPKNAINMVNAISNAVCSADEKNAKEYKSNTESYIKELEQIDSEFENIVDNARRKEFIFGDRFPLLYFAKEYGIKYYAAFPGCSSETEPSASTLAFLCDKMREDNIPYVLKIELSSSAVANTIASEVNAEVKTFYSCHNLTKEQFDNRESYLSMMKENIKTLKTVLN